jgi:hypothetical protein
MVRKLTVIVVLLGVLRGTLHETIVILDFLLYNITGGFQSRLSYMHLNYFYLTQLRMTLALANY